LACFVGNLNFLNISSLKLRPFWLQ